MIDIQKMRAELMRCVEAYAVDGNMSMGHVANMLNQAIDELEATRRPVAPCRFDVAAAREELSEIDADWVNGRGGSYEDVVTILNNALAAIDAGRDVDLEGAAIAARNSDQGVNYTEWPDYTREASRDSYRRIARAVLAHVGRAPTGAPRAVAITPEVVEEAAIVGWCAPDEGGHVTTPDTWAPLPAWRKNRERNIARAVLEYAASLGLGAPAQPATSRPFRPSTETSQSVLSSACYAAGYTEEQTIERFAAHAAILERDLRRALEIASPRMAAAAAPDDRAERLTRYRCSLLQGYVGNMDEMYAMYTHYADHGRFPLFDPWLAAKAEDIAHAMLAAERSPARG